MEMVITLGFIIVLTIVDLVFIKILEMQRDTDEILQSEIDTLKAQVKTLESTSRGGGH
jgi:hypothetical protein